VFVGVLRLTFHVPHARSLKDKRRVILKFRDRVRARFDVSIAEVAEQDMLQRAVFGVTVVSGTQEDAVLTDRATEVIPIGDDLYGDQDGR